MEKSMTNFDSVQSVINRHFQHVQYIGDGIVRGERRYNDKPYAVTYIDLSDSVVERSRHLKEFQESVLGEDFFSPESDLRWNSYLYFLAGPKSIASGEFGSAKNLIESDRHFARKLVLTEQDLARRLGEENQVESELSTKSVDVSSTWAELLHAASLAVLLEQRPRTTALELMANGEAFKAEVVLPPPIVPPQTDLLGTALLRRLTIGSFRRINKDTSYDFGDVNLIVGANGKGKTSLLEAIEVLYCGRVRRDPDAAFVGIVGAVETEQGDIKTIKATTTPAVLKARNMSWYGRADVQSNAITQGFTRFNFLDTDAAFRLSSEQSNEQIKMDFSRLLVGSETSKLWTYLSKLEEEVAVRLRGLDDRLLSDRRHVELLADEVKRYKEAPSEANTLHKAFNSVLSDLKPLWKQVAESTALEPNDRGRLELLSKSIAQVLSVFSETPVTINRIRQRVAQVQGTLESAKKLQSEHDIALKQVSNASARAEATQSSQNQLELWLTLVEAEVPALTKRLIDAAAKVSALRNVLSGQPADTLPEVPAEYAQMRLNEAVILARLRIDQAREQENAAANALSQRIQLGQTLAMLRRDLHDSSVAFIEQSGDASNCPVCGTMHTPDGLLAKIQSLIASDSLSAADSLRHNVQLAKERVDQARRTVEILVSLEKFCVNSNSDSTATSEAIYRDLNTRREELSFAMAELQASKSALEALDLTGLNWKSWEQTRDAAIHLLPEGVSPGDVSLVKVVLDKIKEQSRTDADALKVARDAVSEITKSTNQIASTELSLPTSNLTPVQVVASIERLHDQVTSALSTVGEISKWVHMDAGTALEELQSKVEASILAYDKVLYALKSEEQAIQQLKKKDEELQAATQTFSKNTSARDNLARAKKILSNIVSEHSLDRATADAFNAIKGKVSDVFAQIHSPAEYELGNLSEGQLIVRRDNKRPHDANQVSTGQRAALALSIFLALNDSAKTAPPVILIDDPVAHIDDLNALSFLDYLRDLVVGGRKQVFFATADVRLAALFQRKFEFLGSKRFKRIVLT